MQGLRDAFPRRRRLRVPARRHDVWRARSPRCATPRCCSACTAPASPICCSCPPARPWSKFMPWHWERRAYERMSAILGYTYGKWANADRAATVFPEEIDVEALSGDLARRTANVIRTADSKPMNLRGQAGLAAEKYWINQDTRVNVATVCRRRAEDAQRVAAKCGAPAADGEERRRTVSVCCVVSRLKNGRVGKRTCGWPRFLKSH
jgi:hypothetical protein